jgi:hypothetical protein
MCRDTATVTGGPAVGPVAVVVPVAASYEELLIPPG